MRTALGPTIPQLNEAGGACRKGGGEGRGGGGGDMKGRRSKSREMESKEGQGVDNEQGLD